MNTFIYGWLTTFFVLIYLRIVGNVKYVIEYTNNDYKQTYEIHSSYGKETVVIYCKEVKHSVLYDSWMLSNCYYTYEVILEQLTNEGVIKNTSTGTYPRFGGILFRRSKYPHTRAINAHLDAVSLSLDQ